MFGIDVTIRIVREKTGSRNIFAGLVDINVVSLLEVVGDGTEIVGVTGSSYVNFDNPLKSVARWRAKQRLNYWYRFNVEWFDSFDY